RIDALPGRGARSRAWTMDAVSARNAVSSSSSQPRQSGGLPGSPRSSTSRSDSVSRNIVLRWLMRTSVGLLVVALGGCNRDALDVPLSDDAQVPLDLAVPMDMGAPRRDLYRPPDLLPRPDLLGPVPPLRFAPPLYQGGSFYEQPQSAVGDVNNDGKID